MVSSKPFRVFAYSRKPCFSNLKTWSSRLDTRDSILERFEHRRLRIESWGSSFECQLTFERYCMCMLYASFIQLYSRMSEFLWRLPLSYHQGSLKAQSCHPEQVEFSWRGKQRFIATCPIGKNNFAKNSLYIVMDLMHQYIWFRQILDHRS